MANWARRVSLFVVVFALAVPLLAWADFENLDVVSGASVHRFKVEIADTDTSRSRGLMYRTNLAVDEGMLFDFGTPLIVRMWMKNTPLSLDMIFIDTAGIIIKIEQRTTPYSTRVISSGGEVKYVLELNSGVTAQLGIGVGDLVRHKIIQSDG